MRRLALPLVLAGLVAGALLGTLGTPDRRIGLSPVFDLWTDVLRDVDQAGMKVTRVSDAEEMRLGAQIAATILATQPEDQAASAYVTEVAQRMRPHLQRPGIQYEFHVLDSPIINAFALPGGYVFVMRGLLDFAKTEAELASVLGHEMGHVDLRHCIERYQYELRLKKAGMPVAGWTVEFAHRVAIVGFGPIQEAEADAAGERLAVDAGYNPNAAESVFLRMQQVFGEPPRVQGATPAGEAAASIANAAGDFLRSHPLSADRAAAMNRMSAQNASRFAGRVFYDGAKNVRQQVARSRHEFPDEFKQF